jgi:hypothetical protein
LYDGSPAEELTKLNDRGDTDVQADLFEGPVWDDGEEVEPETPATSAGSDVGEDEDDVEAHASGFG